MVARLLSGTDSLIIGGTCPCMVTNPEIMRCINGAINPKNYSVIKVLLSLS
jgi:hypothetical protein